MIDRNDDGHIRRRQGDSRKGGLRHKMDVPARIMLKGGGRLDAKIRNVSATGMYLRHAMLAEKGDVEVLQIGNLVLIYFAPDPENAPGEKVRLYAEIVRRLPHGIGVRFLNMTSEHKRALRVLAVLAFHAREVSATAAKDAESSSTAKRDARVITSACRKVIERRLPNMIWALRTEVAKRLRLMPRGEAHGKGLDGRVLAQIIEDKGTVISRTIERRVIQTFAEVGGLDDTQEVLFTGIQRAKIKAAAGREPNLVANETLDGTVAMDATCQRFESALASKSFDVNVRLANVVRRRIDNIENPLVPKVICRMMWESVAEHSNARSVHTCLHDTLIEQVVPLLSDLYDEIQKTLDQHQVPRVFGGGGALKAR